MAERLHFQFHSPPADQPKPAPAAKPASSGKTVGTNIGDKLVPVFEISINGQKLPIELVQAFISCEVQQNAKLATMIVLRFHNPRGSVGDNAAFNHGGDLE